MQAKTGKENAQRYN